MTNDTVNSMDSNMLLSIINMKLRDQYSSLDLLCDDLELIKENIINKLESIGYNYNESKNQFK
jgi:hypothetical protein